MSGSRTVIVTGGAGFIGSALVRHLVGECGWNVAVVDKLTYAANLSSLDPISKMENFKFVKADICDRQAIEELFDQVQPSAIFHLAAESHVDRSINGSAEFVHTNILGTHVLLETVRRYWSGLEPRQKSDFRFLHVSTDEVFGTLAPGQFFNEESAYCPRSPYSASKAASDHLVSAWHETYGIPAIITNCSNNYGPYHFPEKLIPLIILNALEYKPLPVYGDGQQERDWLYVDDHVRGLVLALQQGKIGETYILGGKTPRTNLDVVVQVCELLDKLRPGPMARRSLVEFVEDRPGHDRRYAIDPSKAEQTLGWKPLETFETGLEKTVNWFLTSEAWWRPVREGKYRGERLGLIRNEDLPSENEQVR